MHDDAPESAADELTNLALLYSTGEMDESEAADFERRLAEDQAARDALCQAVEMNLTVTGEAPTAPDPAYRQRVRQRLHQRRRHLRKLAGQPTFAGHPALWTAIGAAAAGLLMVVMHHLALFPDRPLTTGPVPPSPSEAPLTVQVEQLKGKQKAAEEQAKVAVAKLAGAVTEEERQTQEQRLHELAQQMVARDAQILTLQIRLKEKELVDARRELAELVAENDQRVQKRFEGLLERAKKLKS